MACCIAATAWPVHADCGAKLVQDRTMRLVQVRAAPQRSVRIRQRASTVHLRRAFVHAPSRYTGDILAFSPPLIVEEAQIGEILWGGGRGVEGGGPVARRF
jgi:hypothetical protein